MGSNVIVGNFDIVLLMTCILLIVGMNQDYL